VPVTAGLSGRASQAASEEFNRRVKAGFPLGSSEKDMVLVLRRQRFLTRRLAITGGPSTRCYAARRQLGLQTSGLHLLGCDRERHLTASGARIAKKVASSLLIEATLICTDQQGNPSALPFLK
jgi:hypothetical protein